MSSLGDMGAVEREFIREQKLDLAYANALVGIETAPRIICQAAAPLSTSGTLRLSYFTPSQSATIGSLVAVTGSTAAAATPTFCRIGLYTAAANNDLTLVASIANDTALWAAAFTEYSSVLVSPASYTAVAGQRYAFGVLCVSAAAVPSFYGLQTLSTATFSRPPVLSRSLAGQTDLPSSITHASTAADSRIIWVGGVA
jgi:hypothetical protein